MLHRSICPLLALAVISACKEPGDGPAYVSDADANVTPSEDGTTRTPPPVTDTWTPSYQDTSQADTRGDAPCSSPCGENEFCFAALCRDKDTYCQTTDDCPTYAICSAGLWSPGSCYMDIDAVQFTNTCANYCQAYQTLCGENIYWPAQCEVFCDFKLANTVSEQTVDALRVCVSGLSSCNALQTECAGEWGAFGGPNPGIGFTQPPPPPGIPDVEGPGSVDAEAEPDTGPEPDVDEGPDAIPDNGGPPKDITG